MTKAKSPKSRESRSRGAPGSPAGHSAPQGRGWTCGDPAAENPRLNPLPQDPGRGREPPAEAAGRPQGGNGTGYRQRGGGGRHGAALAGVARGTRGLPASASPASRGGSNFPPSAERRLGRAGFRNFVRPPIAPGPLSPTPPARPPHPAATAACARPPPGSARVYLRPRSRRRLRRRRQPHCRSPGSRHAAAKFPNMDSVRSEVFRGPLRPALLAGAGGGGGGAGSGPGLRCSARLAPPLLPLPPPRLASSRSAPRVPFPLPLFSPRLSRAATGRRATVTPAAAAAAADPSLFPYPLALALRARLQRSTRPQGGAGNPPFATEERDGRSQVTRPASRREGPSSWRGLLGNVLNARLPSHAAGSAPARRAGVSLALPAVHPKLQKTVKKALGEQDMRGFVRPLLSYLLLKTVFCCLAVD